MKQENDIRLKRGWTTGACATAATKAGLYALWSGEKLDVVSITLPKGEQPLFRISFFEHPVMIPYYNHVVDIVVHCSFDVLFCEQILGHRIASFHLIKMDH